MLTQRYQQLIRQCFSNKHCEDLPNYWPEIAGIHFVGLVEQRFLAQDLNIDELRDDIYNTALNLNLPLGMCVLEYNKLYLCPDFQKESSTQIILRTWKIIISHTYKLQLHLVLTSGR